MKTKKEKEPLDPIETTILPIASMLSEFSRTIPPDLTKWNSLYFQQKFEYLDIELVRIWLDEGGFSDAARQFEERLNQFLSQLKNLENDIHSLPHSKIQYKEEILFWKSNDIRRNAVNIAQWLKKLAYMINLKYPKDKTNKECSHSPDYRKITWFGKPYKLSKNRAIAIRLLWEAHENPNKVGVHEREIGKALDTVNANYRLIDTFRVKHNGKRGYDPAWKEIIEHVGNGIYRLKEPQK